MYLWETFGDFLVSALMYNFVGLQDVLVSRMSRKSIDLLKLHFKDELTRDDWKLVVKLKKVFNIE